MSHSAWEAHLKAFHEQKRLEEYQQNRVLPRPKTTRLTVVCYVLVLIVVALSGGWMLFGLAPFSIWTKILLSTVFFALLVETYGRAVAVKVVECYQHDAPEATRRKCKCIPSCSEYAILCLKKHELIRALLKIRKRLYVTCVGFEYIIDNP